MIDLERSLILFIRVYTLIMYIVLSQRAFLYLLSLSHRLLQTTAMTCKLCILRRVWL